MGIAIRCGTLIDGTGAEPRRNVVVLVEGNRIKAIGDDRLLQGDHTVLDCTAQVVLPGLIDAHAHLCMDGNPDPRPAKTHTPVSAAFYAAQSLERAIRSGVTTMREAGAPHGVSFGAKQAVAEGRVAGPRLLVSGAAIAMTGGHGWHTAREVTGVDEARRAAREQLKQGADVIKLMATGGVITPGEALGGPQLTVEEMAAAVEEAHKAGKRVMAHAMGPIGIRNALVAGVDTIEHGVFFNQESIELMLQHDAYLIPTFSVNWQQSQHGREMGMQAYIIEKASQAAEQMFECAALARAAGVKIAMGTDAGGPGVQHGMVALELELMLKSGACRTEAEVICSATSRAADALGLLNELGTVEVGKVADILVLRSDPLQSLDAFRHVSMVIKEGALVHRAAS